jgi:lysophospholipid acyltransferase (LPLAT)-like uncharacterized protein
MLKIQKLPLHLKILVKITQIYIKVLWYTCRWTFETPTETQKLFDNNLPIIAIFWHGRMVMMPKAKPHKYRLDMLNSHNKAGTFMSQMCEPFNIGTIKGSSINPSKPTKDKGGMQAVRDMVKTLKNGIAVGLTPDGPRGPAMKMTDGALMIARLSGIPIIPVTFSAKSGYFTKTWDRLLLPYPFTKGTIKHGEPFYVPRDMQDNDMENYRLKLENIMNNMVEELDIRLRQ